MIINFLRSIHCFKRYKRILLFAASSVIMMSIVGGATFAFWTYLGRSRNVITTGRIAISIVEQQKTDDGYVPYPDKPIGIMPSDTVSKVVSVRCDEEQAYVRMKYSLIIRDPQGNETDLDPSVIRVVPTGTADGWVDGGDGWFYYDAVLSAGDITAPLFEEVTCICEAGNEYQNTTVILRVHAQSVQAKNNAAPDGDVTAVKGWPLG